MGPIIKFRVPGKSDGKPYYVDPTDAKDFNLIEYILSIFDILRIEKVVKKKSLTITIYMGHSDPIEIELEEDRFIDANNYKLVKQYVNTVYKQISKHLAIEDKKYKRYHSHVMTEYRFEEMLERIGLYIEP
jgi:hypothetical protein